MCIIRCILYTIQKQVLPIFFFPCIFKHLPLMIVLLSLTRSRLRLSNNFSSSVAMRSSSVFLSADVRGGDRIRGLATLYVPLAPWFLPNWPLSIISILCGTWVGYNGILFNVTEIFNLLRLLDLAMNTHGCGEGFSVESLLSLNSGIHTSSLSSSLLTSNWLLALKPAITRSSEITAGLVWIFLVACDNKSTYPYFFHILAQTLGIITALLIH